MRRAILETYIGADVVSSILRRGDEEPNPGTPKRDPGDEPVDRHGRIRCPRCKWIPRRKDRWRCSCQHRWNTFETHGVCPECGRKWNETQCLRCQEWSAHEAWYERPEA